MAALNAATIDAAMSQSLASVDVTGALTLNGNSLGNYEIKELSGNQTVTSGTPMSNYFNTTADESAWIKVNGNLTIDAGGLLKPTVRKLFTVVYVVGDLVVNGEISMTARGASFAGITPADLPIILGLAGGVMNPKVPATGGAGGPAVNDGFASDGSTGTAGTNGGTGGGGSGSRYQGGSGGGSAGSCFGGGTGGGAGDPGPGGNGSTTGGTGGNGSGVHVGGGSGNPGGTANGFGGTGGTGTGGVIIIICTGNYTGSGTVTAHGVSTNGGSQFGNNAGGASGGGSATILHTGAGTGPIPICTGGGQASAQRIGGYGGAGSARRLKKSPPFWEDFGSNSAMVMG